MYIIVLISVQAEKQYFLFLAKFLIKSQNFSTPSPPQESLNLVTFPCGLTPKVSPGEKGMMGAAGLIFLKNSLKTMDLCKQLVHYSSVVASPPT